MTERLNDLKPLLHLETNNSSEEQQQQLEDLLRKNFDLFALNDSDLGCTKWVQL